MGREVVDCVELARYMVEWLSSCGEFRDQLSDYQLPKRTPIRRVE